MIFAARVWTSIQNMPELTRLGLCWAGPRHDWDMQGHPARVWQIYHLSV